jgi:hypothetical protein
MRPQILKSARQAVRKEIGMTQSIERVDHTIPKEEAVFAFDPEMRPVLEVSPGEVVTFE